MAAQIGERGVIVAVEQGRDGLLAYCTGAKDFADEAATQLFRAHRCACDFRWAIFRLPWSGILGYVRSIRCQANDLGTVRAIPTARRSF
jgi:hypothetical protein